MTEQNPAKMQLVLWWITSIAVSVLCCSVIFIVFASYVVDLKTTMRDEQLSINTLEQRENALALQIENMQKPAVSAAAPAAETPIGSAVPLSSVVPAETPAAPVAATPAAPAEISPPASVVTPIGSSVPTITVPTVPTNSTPSAK
jgi:hypothetical protein